MAFLLRVLINGIAIWLADLVLSGLDIVGFDDSPWAHFWVILGIALVFGLVNAIIKPIVAFLSIPLYVLTLGLFTLVVNALMLWLTAWITEFTDWGLRIEDFWAAVLGGLIIAVISFTLSVLIPESRRA
jgi:putative membrane protein